MKKLVISLGVLIFIVLYLFTSCQAIKSERSSDVLTYLENKYHQEFEIKGSETHGTSGLVTFTVESKTNPGVSFIVFYHSKKWIRDTYVESLE